MAVGAMARAVLERSDAIRNAQRELGHLPGFVLHISTLQVYVEPKHKFYSYGNLTHARRGAEGK
eukprot:4526699-Lingulodinium_polyedra.AAC.1